MPLAPRLPAIVTAPVAPSAHEVRPFDANPPSEQILVFAQERGQSNVTNTVNAADPSHDKKAFDLSDLVLIQRNNTATEDALGRPIDPLSTELREGDFKYVVTDRVVAGTTRGEIKVGGRTWKMHRRGTQLITHEFGRKTERSVDFETKERALDLDVYDHRGNLVFNHTYDGQEELFTLLDSHGPIAERDAAEKAATGRGHYKSELLFPLLGSTKLPRGPLELMTWEDKSKPLAEAAPATRVDRPIALDPSRDILEQIFEDYDRQDLPEESLVGLTFDIGDHRLQITNDALIQAPHLKNTPFVRVWEVSEWGRDGAGNLVQQKQKPRAFRDNQLRGLLNDQRLVVGSMHWQFSADHLNDVEAARTAEQAAMLGRAAVRWAKPVLDPALPSKAWHQHITPEDAEELFNGLDMIQGFDTVVPQARINTQRAATAGMTPAAIARLPRNQQPDLLRTLRNKQLKAIVVAKFELADKIYAESKRVPADRNEKEFAAVLRKFIRLYGSREISEVSKTIRDSYLQDCAALGLQVGQDDHGVGWILHDMSEQGFYAANRHKADKSRQDGKAGVEVGNPMLTRYPAQRKTARRKRREIIDHKIGLNYVNAVIASQMTEVAETFVGNAGVQVAGIPTAQFGLGDEVTYKRLQEFVQPQIHSIVNRIANRRNEKGEIPTHAELTRIGRLLRRQIKQ